ncbi:MAG: hypothetical protein RLZZ32_2017 [Cyanobacteriota bacterium]|jgi:oxalate decarboxylase/phosphoglucose isomerase-like protein (cupin superfamily)
MPMRCLMNSRQVEIVPRANSLSGSLLFSEPQTSDETLIAEVSTAQRGELFCHRFQTDQLLVLSGSFDLIVLQERRLRCITLRDDEGTWVRIPPGVPHGAINRGSRPAVVVNAVLRHGPSHPRDYQPRPIPASLQQEWMRLAA